MMLPLALILFSAVPARAPAIGAEVGAGMLHNLAPSLNAEGSLELPGGDLFSLRIGVDGTTVPYLWRVGTSMAMLVRTSAGPVELGAGPAIVAGLGTLPVTDVAPPLAVDVGGGLLAAIGWAINDSFSVRVSALVPAAAVFELEPSSLPPFLAISPRLTIGATWRLAS